MHKSLHVAVVLLALAGLVLWTSPHLSEFCLRAYREIGIDFSFYDMSLDLGFGENVHEPFNCTEQTIDSIHTLLYEGRVSCREIVQGYLAKIEALNPSINAIITLNKQSLDIADTMDSILRKNSPGELTDRALFCIPVLLKDNYETSDMPTTAGSIGLAGFQPSRNAPVVERLKKAGAIILGKTNMHEFALEGLSVSSLGGQTHNPYDLSRTPGGSSGGSGAAVAASFSTFATASDTVNSIRSPAASNALFGIRPSRGLISRDGIIPLGYTQDAIGPIARTPRDLAIAFDVMVGEVGFDIADNLTALVREQDKPASYVQSLTGKALDGARIGIITTLFDHVDSNETTPVNQAIAKAIKVISSAGATIVNITNPMFNSIEMLTQYDVQRFEFPSILTEYLQRQGGAVPYQSFDEVYASQEFLPLCYREVLGDAIGQSVNDPAYKQRIASHKILRARLLEEFSRYQLDAVLYPEQQNLVVPIGAPSQKGRNGILAAITGCPVVVVPAGYSPATPSAPIGIPIGMELLGLPFSEAKLLDLAYSYDILTRVRMPPVIAREPRHSDTLTRVPLIRPDRSVSAEYLRGSPKIL